MVFSSTLFLFFFLPLVMGLYFLAGHRGRNLVLLCASLFFYAWGENLYLLVMLFSIGANYGFGLLIDWSQRRGGRGRYALWLAVIVNLSLLGFFKYANFLVDNLNLLLQALELQPMVLEPVHLPIGISFFTFQALSYVIDLFRRDTQVQRNPLKVGLYITLFPQLIAGPIVRYHDIAQEMGRRIITPDDIGSGIRRFIVGLGKKVLVANVLGRTADYIFSLPPDRIPMSLAWLGAIAYTLQIYYDFSGYSDMAIGLGRIFGFHFLENFRYPYSSRSIREFWQRWHISLSSWFRDYLYIPLGGSRCSVGRTYLHLLIVFFLCGWWHGASWTFIVWGLYHGCFLVIERLGPVRRLLEGLPAVLSHVYVLVVVIVGWVFFRAESLTHALGYLQSMVSLSRPELFNTQVYLILNREFYAVLVVAVIGSAPVIELLRGWRRSFVGGPSLTSTSSPLAAGLEMSGLAFLLAYSVASLLGGGHNPFLYFRF